MREKSMTLPGLDKKMRIVIVGAGRIGRQSASILARDGRFSPLLADIDHDALSATEPGIETAEVGFSLPDFLRRTLPEASAVLCAAPSCYIEVAEAARSAGCHYVNVADDTSEAPRIAQIAEGANKSFVTSCGFAPGYVTALLREAIEKAGPQSQIELQVGVLPAERLGRLGYANMWGVEGLISEYTRPCIALRDGKIIESLPLSGYSKIEVEGESLEVFSTAGSLDAMIHEKEGQLRSLSYKTIRYPGHLDYMQFLLDDMGFKTRLYALKNLLLNALPRMDRDRAIIRIVHRQSPDAAEEVVLRHFAATPNPAGGWTPTITRISAVHACAVLDVICSPSHPLAGHRYGDSFPLAELAESPMFVI